MKRRQFMLSLLAVSVAPLLSRHANASPTNSNENIGILHLTDYEWEKRLSPEQFRVLRDNGTERAHSSPLNHEKRSGTYVCAGCEQPLFSSAMKYDSGTGWPSFFKALPNAITTKKEFSMFYTRTEYHCSRCKGHQGHVFGDGPEPTGKRYCNNGVALKFISAHLG
ncbi:peptide-methionine (R)-S-oxide reductase MsrB [Pseudomonadota bacterium]